MAGPVMIMIKKLNTALDSPEYVLQEASAHFCTIRTREKQEALSCKDW